MLHCPADSLCVQLKSHNNIDAATVENNAIYQRQKRIKMHNRVVATVNGTAIVIGRYKLFLRITLFTN